MEGWVEGRMDGWMDGRESWVKPCTVEGWMEGWVVGKAGLRIAYSNQKVIRQSSKKLQEAIQMRLF